MRNKNISKEKEEIEQLNVEPEIIENQEVNSVEDVEIVSTENIEITSIESTEPIYVENTENISDENPKKYVKVTSKALNVRKDPRKDGDVLTIVYEDDLMELLDETNIDGFYSVKTENGYTGYCMIEFVKIV